MHPFRIFGRAADDDVDGQWRYLISKITQRDGEAVFASKNAITHHVCDGEVVDDVRPNGRGTPWVVNPRWVHTCAAENRE